MEPNGIQRGISGDSNNGSQLPIYSIHLGKYPHRTVTQWSWYPIEAIVSPGAPMIIPFLESAGNARAPIAPYLEFEGIYRAPTFKKAWNGARSYHVSRDAPEGDKGRKMQRSSSFGYTKGSFGSSSMMSLGFKMNSKINLARPSKIPDSASGGSYVFLDLDFMQCYTSSEYMTLYSNILHNQNVIAMRMDRIHCGTLKSRVVFHACNCVFEEGF